jgi:hypothetical protein
LSHSAVAILAYIVGTIEVLAGFGIQWPKTARGASVALAAIYLMFAALWVPVILRRPATYGGWGNFFEQFSQVAGALIIFGCFDRVNADRAKKAIQFGYTSFGVCVVSFTLEQILYLRATAAFVPKWIPPGQMFWAVTTTIAFALAALALFTGYSALLASRLLTAMIVGFGLLIWLPAPFTKPFSDSHINWAGNAENLAIAGAAWIVADWLGERRATKSLRAAA